MVVEGVVAHYGVFKGLKLGMRERLDIVDDNLEKITQVVEALAKEHIAGGRRRAEEKKASGLRPWMPCSKLTATCSDQPTIRLTPEEAAAVERMIDAKQAELEAVRIQHEEAAEKSVADGPTRKRQPAKSPRKRNRQKKGPKRNNRPRRTKAGGQAVEAKPGQAKPAEAKPGKAKPMEAKPVKTEAGGSRFRHEAH